MKNSTIVSIIFLLFLFLVTTPNSVYAQSFQRVTTIEGFSDQTTNYFTIPAGQWRLNWNYTSVYGFENYAVFSVIVHQKGETMINTASIYQTGANQKSGVTVIPEGGKEYYLEIIALNLDYYVINIDAQPFATVPSPTIPEYPFAIGIFTIMIGVLSIILVKKANNKKMH